jgi:hypothetical protein
VTKVARWGARWALVTVALALIAGGTVWFVLGNQHETARADTEHVKAVSEQAKKEQVVAAAGPLCAQPAKNREVTRLCAEVQQAKQAAPLPAERVDYARVQTMVDQAVATDPNTSEAAILALVREVYSAHPPKDGKTPTDAQLLVLIRQVYRANPPAPGEDGAAGQPGADGAPGRDGEPGKDGAPGPQGISVVGFRFARADDGSCQLQELLHNPADGSDQTVSVSAPDQFCAQPAPPTSTTEQPGSLLGGGGN